MTVFMSMLYTEILSVLLFFRNGVTEWKSFVGFISLGREGVYNFFFISFVFCFWTQIWFLICWFNETFQLIGQKYLWIDNHTCIYYTAMKLIDEFGNYKGVYIEGWKSQLSTICPCSKEQYYFFYLYIVYIKSTYRRLVLRQMYNVYKTQSELLNKKCQCTFIYST